MILQRLYRKDAPTTSLPSFMYALRSYTFALLMLSTLGVEGHGAKDSHEGNTQPIVQEQRHMQPIVIQTSEAFESAIQSPKPILVVFYKVGCSYCEVAEPIIEEVVQAVAGQVKVYVMKVTNTNKAMYKTTYGFKAFPRCALFKDGTMQSLLDIPSESLTKEKLLAFVAQDVAA